jgi:hypothetical protein
MQAGIDRETERAAATLAAGGLTSTPVNDVVSVARAAAVPAGMSYAELIADADAIIGHVLEKDKAQLIGIPFVITSVTFRDGVLRNKKPTNYLSIEAVLADAATLRVMVERGRLTIEQARRVTPNEMIVINDGSTGIARQIIGYMHAKKMITCPEGPEVGGTGETRYDVYRSEWIKGFDVDVPNPRFEFTLVCPRGLRVSEYETDQTAGDASTFYLA